jgi:hypothetical protein
VAPRERFVWSWPHLHMPLNSRLCDKPHLSQRVLATRRLELPLPAAHTSDDMPPGTEGRYVSRHPYGTQGAVSGESPRWPRPMSPGADDPSAVPNQPGTPNDTNRHQSTKDVIMRGHLVQRGDRYDAVVDEGIDPATGKEPHRWYPAEHDTPRSREGARRSSALRTQISAVSDPSTETWDVTTPSVRWRYRLTTISRSLWPSRSATSRRGTSESTISDATV